VPLGDDVTQIRISLGISGEQHETLAPVRSSAVRTGRQLGGIGASRRRRHDGPLACTPAHACRQHLSHSGFGQLYSQNGSNALPTTFLIMKNQT